MSAYRGSQSGREYKEFVCELVEHTKQSLKDMKHERVNKQDIEDLEDIMGF